MDEALRKHPRIDYLIGVYFLVLISGLITPLAFMLSPRGHLPVSGSSVLVGNFSDLENSGSLTFLYRGSPCLAIYLDGRALATSALCPLDDALLSWDRSRQILSCPVSGDTFDAAGNHLSGAAHLPLRTLDTREVQGRVYARGAGS